MILVAKKDKFNLYISLAIVIHVVVFGISFLFQGVTSRPKVEDVTKNFIKSSIRIDVVGMPKKTILELKETEISPPTKKEEAKKGS